MVKKVLSITLVLAICFICAGALAAEERTAFDMPAVGMRFVFPEAYENAKGWIGTDGVMDQSVLSFPESVYVIAPRSVISEVNAVEQD